MEALNSMLSSFYQGDTNTLQQIEADDYILIADNIYTTEGRYKKINEK